MNLHEDDPFRTDSRAEKEFAKFLDECFYSQLLCEQNESRFTSITRIFDKPTQQLGIDVIGLNRFKEFRIDEKSALRSMDKRLTTFAFELTFISQTTGMPMVGWFIRKDLKTNYYLVCWPDASEHNVEKVNACDFNNVEAMIIPKRRLKQYLLGEGLTTMLLYNKAVEIRGNGIGGKYKIPGKDGLLYSFSPDYKERPINLLVSKDILEKLCVGHYKIFQDGFFRVTDSTNFLSKVYPEMEDFWVSRKNDFINFQDIRLESNQKVWWKCSECGYQFKSLISDFVRDPRCWRCRSKEVL